MGHVEIELRKILAFSHRHSATMYFDDGEMQCSTCDIDFKRDSPEVIYSQMHKQALKEFNERSSTKST
jgi:hypothetical protein